MGKLFLFLLVCVGVWWWLGRAKSKASPPPHSGGERPAELMVSCAYCGVNQPRSECMESAGRHYCSEAHRAAHEREANGG